MCQSKAQGGKRCNAYLERQVTTGLVAATAAVTGAKRAEVRDLHAELVASAIDGPDPTRDEVDQFLTETDFRVRHDPTLDAPVRERISSRLRAAIGRILPSRKTLSAWRTLLSEAWTRSHRKATTGFAAMAMVFSVGACGNTPDNGEATPVSSDSISQTATAAPSETSAPAPEQEQALDVSTADWGQDPKVTIGIGPRDFFGTEGAAEGTDAALAVVKDFSLHEDLVAARPKDLSFDQFDAITSQMTPGMRDDFKQTVRAFSSSGGRKQAGDMRSLVWASVDSQFPDSITYRVDRTVSDPITSRQLTSISARLASNDNLEVVTTATFVVRFKDTDGSIYSGQYERETRLYMIPSGDAWQINGYRGSTQFKDWL